MNLTKIALIGYGRMGKAIEQLAPQYQAEITYIIAKEDAGEWDLNKLRACDVAIEFSQPEAAFNNIKKCIELGIPIVSGTTGWLDKLEDIRQLLDSKDSAFLYGSNFSLGVNVFFRVNQYLASLIHPSWDYRANMTEIHHIHKLDEPSGTAISLANDIINTGQYDNWKLGASSDPTTLPIQSIREGEVPGTHIISYENSIDKITISHEAKNRDGFASGAIQAAKWLVGKQGFFTINDFVDDLLEKL